MSKFAALMVCLLAVAVAGCAPHAAALRVRHRLVSTEISQRHIVKVGDLIGLTPEEAQRKLTGLTMTWPTPMAIEMASPDGMLSFTNLFQFLQDPAASDITTRAQDQTDSLPEAWSQCRAGYTQGDDQTPVGAILASLEFRDGRLAAVWKEPAPGAWRTATATLEDGPSFTARWPRQALAADTEIAVACQHKAMVAIPMSGSRASTAELTAGDLHGLALAPLAFSRLPRLNALRVAAKREGWATYEQLPVGTPLVGGASAFARTHRFVTVFPSPAPNYVLLKIDLGAYPSRNLTYFHDWALVGVRDNRVAWRSRSDLNPIEGLAAEREAPPSKDRTHPEIWGSENGR